MIRNQTPPPLRSVLYVPADRPRVLVKAEQAGADAVIFDLEDAVSPDAKEEAREALRAHFEAYTSPNCFRAVRINGFATPWGTEDFLAARSVEPDAIVLPKVESIEDILMLEAALDQSDAPDTIAIWAMIETPKGVLNAATISTSDLAGTKRLQCLVAGTNDLQVATGASDGDGSRAFLAHWLSDMVLAARAGGLLVLDGVLNDHSDDELLHAQCIQARGMGFDGKTLIHPAQIAIAKQTFSPSLDELEQANRIVAAFEQHEDPSVGVLSVDGKMVERLHLDQARKVLATAQTLGDGQ